MKYWFIINGVRLGPMTLQEAQSQMLTPETPVWTEGMPDWTTVANVPELAAMLSAGNAPQQNPPYGGVPNPAYGYTTPQQPQYGNMPPRPDNYMVWSILVTILCCLIGGIIAIVYSSKVNSAYDMGNYDQALANSRKAKTWIIVSVCVGLLYGVFAFILGFFGTLAEML